MTHVNGAAYAVVHLEVAGYEREGGHVVARAPGRCIRLGRIDGIFAGFDHGGSEEGLIGCSKGGGGGGRGWGRSGCGGGSGRAGRRYVCGRG